MSNRPVETDYLQSRGSPQRRAAKSLSKCCLAKTEIFNSKETRAMEIKIECPFCGGDLISVI